MGYGCEDIFFYWSSSHIPLLVLRKILLWYGSSVFLSQKYGKPIQIIHGSQNFAHLIFSINLGRFEKRLKTSGL